MHILAWTDYVVSSAGKLLYSLADFQSNRSQVKTKMKVKSATYFKLKKKLCIDMNSYFLGDTEQKISLPLALEV
jgi:hypothetical protein